MPTGEIRRSSTIVGAGSRNDGTQSSTPTQRSTRPGSRLINMQANPIETAPQNHHASGNATPWPMANPSARSTAGRSVYNPAASRAPGGQDQLARQMGQFHLDPTPQMPAAQGVFNPSEGPSPSMAPGPWRSHSRAPSRASTTSSIRAPVKTDIYVISGKRRKDFKQGEVISLPYHVSNTNPTTNPGDKKLSFTWLGPTYSKRRMMVILWIFQESLFCLPLYSFSQRGISAKADFLQKEYVCMKNVDDKDFVNEGMYEPVEVKARMKDLSPETTVQLTGGMRVSFDEEIANVGRLTQDSYEHLIGLWQETNEEAHGMQWRP